MKSLLTVILIGFGSSAWADCACFCAGGELRTMCSTVSEAQDNPTICATKSSEICPVDSEQGEPVSYESPSAGAVDCRSMRVWNSLDRSFVDVQVCDVLES
jgi:hypothetical protein